MTIDHPERSRLRRMMFVPIAAALIAAAAEPAHAQSAPGVQSAQPATRGGPVLRTPPRKARPRAARPAPGRLQALPGRALAGAPGALGGAPGAPGSGDPMAAAGVKLAAREIDFRPLPGNALVSFQLDDADLPELVKAISSITGKRFIYGEQAAADQGDRRSRRRRSRPTTPTAPSSPSWRPTG